MSMSDVPVVVISNGIQLDTIDTTKCNSPQREDDDLLLCSIVEGKKTEAESSEALLCQLKANMLVACTKVFIDTIQEGTDASLITKELLVTYGIACTGAGSFAFAKLMIDFKLQKCKFKYKIPLRTRSRVFTAALFDYCIAYIASKKH